MSDARTVAALYVLKDGPYFGIPGVDPWDEDRDARNYPGPHPVVAHPPCARWGKCWWGGPGAKVKRKLGDDGGLFEHALWCVETYGGVLEHPEASYAFRRFNLPVPPKSGGWVAGIRGGWSCCVEQGHYGHRARKATWLYAFGTVLHELRWGASESSVRLDDGYHSAEERRSAARDGRTMDASGWSRLSKRERKATPPEFRDMLISLARSVK